MVCIIGVGFYLSCRTGFLQIRKFSYAIQIGMEVKALVPDYPVILPGDTFTSTLRVCNTGMLPIYKFDIDFLATPEGSASAAPLPHGGHAQPPKQ